MRLERKQARRESGFIPVVAANFNLGSRSFFKPSSRCLAKFFVNFFGEFVARRAVLPVVVDMPAAEDDA